MEIGRAMLRDAVQPAAGRQKTLDDVEMKAYAIRIQKRGQKARNAHPSEEPCQAAGFGSLFCIVGNQIGEKITQTVDPQQNFADHKCPMQVRPYHDHQRQKPPGFAGYRRGSAFGLNFLKHDIPRQHQDYGERRGRASQWMAAANPASRDSTNAARRFPPRFTIHAKRSVKVTAKVRFAQNTTPLRPATL